MKILMVASEAASFVKTGGLADVLGALPAALARLGDDVAVVLPKYRAAVVPSGTLVWRGMPLWVGPHYYSVDIEQVVQRGVRYFLVDCPVLYDRATLYDEADNDLRFALLSHAALGIVRYVFRAEIVHSHDWQAGLLPAYLHTTFSGDPTFFGVRTVFTIHNAGYQGNFAPGVRADLGIDPALYHPAGLEFWGQVSFFKAAIVWSDALTTVSPTYALEIQTPEYGYGMDGVLRTHAAKLSGILNGVDYEQWNPEQDPLLVAHYSARDLSGKRAEKKALLREMGLPDDAGARPLIGIVSRFAGQKGFDLLERIAVWLGEQDVALVALGSGEARFEEMFRSLAETWPDKFAVRIGYDDGLAHRIEAGADMFLMPSRYEPCGLNQIYSLHYGTVPIVRATGGLDDTVDETTGFKFHEYTPEALQGAIQEALDAFADRDAWTARMRRGMAKNFSWDASAAEYQKLYRSLNGRGQ
jgi:starch synthase